VVIGYVLLITFGIILSSIVFNYLRTYVPSDITECPDGVSVFLKDYSYDCTLNRLNLTIKNNGKFNFEGYFIHGTNSSKEELATIDISKNFDENRSINGVNLLSTVYFHREINLSFKPNEEEVHVFNLNKTLYSIEIIPVRFQREGSSERFVSCGGARIKEKLTCS